MRTRRILVVDASVGAAEALALLPDIDGFDVHCVGNRHPRLTVYFENPTEGPFAWPEDDDLQRQSHELPEG